MNQNFAMRPEGKDRVSSMASEGVEMQTRATSTDNSTASSSAACLSMMEYDSSSVATTSAGAGASGAPNRRLQQGPASMSSSPPLTSMGGGGGTNAANNTPVTACMLEHVDEEDEEAAIGGGGRGRGRDLYPTKNGMNACGLEEVDSLSPSASVSPTPSSAGCTGRGLGDDLEDGSDGGDGDGGGGGGGRKLKQKLRWPCGMTNFHVSLCVGVIGFFVFWLLLLLRIYLPHEYFL